MSTQAFTSDNPDVTMRTSGQRQTESQHFPIALCGLLADHGPVALVDTDCNDAFKTELNESDEITDGF